MTIKRTAAALLAAVCCTAVIPSVPAVVSTAADPVVVDTTTEYQTIRGFGGMNHPEWQSVNLTANTTADMTAEQVQTAFGNGPDELGLTILRIFVSDDQNAWKNAIPTAKRAAALGATIFATPWNPPSSMRSAGSGGPNGGQYVLSNGKEADYAKHLNDFIKYCNGQGVELNSISVQNEPDWSGEWTYWSPDRAANFIANYGKSVTAGTNTKLMSPESFSYNKSYYNAILNNSAAMANCDMFGTHFYGTARNSMDFPALEKTGKDIWMTEVYVPNSDNNSADRWPEGVQVAENIHNALVVGNMNAYVWWYVRRQYSFLWDTGKISKRGYAMAQFSKWVRPGDVRVDCTESPSNNILCSAYKNDNHQVTIVAINKNTSPVTQEFKLGSGESIVEIDRYRTSGSENIAASDISNFNGSTFSSELPASSVSTFVVSLEGAATSPADVTDEDGYYFHDTFETGTNSWSGRGAASAEQSTAAKYAGSNSLYCDGRTASWNGAQKTLNLRVFKPGVTYSFSVDAMYKTGEPTEEFKLTLQYTGSDNEAHYANIATATTTAGNWVQLKNLSYCIPEDASNAMIYVETSDTNTSFYIDEAIGAPQGVSVAGPEAPVIETPTQGNSPAPSGKITPGDVNLDGYVDAFDMVYMRKGLVSGFSGTNNEKAADVDNSGKAEVNDAVQLTNFLLGKIKQFEVVAKPQKENKWDTYQETASSDWLNFYGSSINSMGNTYRLTQKLEAAEDGAPLTVAYLGGSITEGKNYSSPFSNYLKTTFAKGGFTEVNAGLSGTSSVVGLVRSEKDIVSHNPDIVVVEFSVNDHEDISYKKSFESVCKKFLDLPNEPAVIILIHRAKGGFSSQEQMVKIGKSLDIPIISMDDALTKAFNSGFLQPGDYFNDEYHPHAKGGQLVADCMAYYVRQAMKTENRSDSYVMPTTAAYGREYSTCVNVDPKTLDNFNAGSWSAGTGYNSLPYSYTLNGGSPMTFKTTGKGFIVVFKANSNGMGSIDFTVNGKTTKINGNKQYTWGGPDAEIGYYQDTEGELNVSISGSGSFTIWGLGLIK